MENQSEFVFVLHGLNESLANRQVYFAFTLAAYVITLLANLTLVATVCAEKTLHEPIFILLVNLCLNGVLGASSFYPKMLADLLADAHVVPYGGCLFQMFVTYSYVFCEFTSLTAMAYDRYAAICRPLRYRALMTPRKVARLVLLAWCLSLLESAAGVALTARLPLCGRHVRKVFCTNWEVVRLSCADTTVNNVYGFVLMFSHLAQTALILVSYGHLVRAALRSRANRRKFVQTCVPHLVTLLVFAGSLVFDIMYSRYGGDEGGGGGGLLQVVKNALAAEFLVVPPLINPIIYGINLQQIRSRIFPKFSKS